MILTEEQMDKCEDCKQDFGLWEYRGLGFNYIYLCWECLRNRDLNTCDNCNEVFNDDDIHYINDQYLCDFCKADIIQPIERED